MHRERHGARRSRWTWGPLAQMEGKASHRFYLRPTEPAALSSWDQLGPPLSWAQASSSPGLCRSPHRSPLATPPAHLPGVFTPPLQVQGAGVDAARAGVDAARPGNCAGPAKGLGLPKRSWQDPQGEGGQGREERPRAGRPQAPAKGRPSPAHPCPSHLDSGSGIQNQDRQLSGVVSAWRMVPGTAATGHSKGRKDKDLPSQPAGWPCQRLAQRMGHLNLLRLQPSLRVPPEPTSFLRPRSVTLPGKGAAAV